MDDDTIEQEPIPSKSNKLIGQMAQPINNLGNNISRTYGLFSNGQIGSGIGSLASTFKNPYGNNSNTGNNQQHFNLPTLSDEHLGDADKNGFRQINDNGQQFLQQAYRPQMAQQSDIQMPQMQPSQPQQNQKGLIGRTLDSAVSILGAGIL